MAATAKAHIWNVYSSMEQEYFTPREIAKRLRVDDSTVRRWIRTGALEAETIRQCRRNRHRIKKVTIDTIEAPSSSHVANCAFFGLAE